MNNIIIMQNTECFFSGQTQFVPSFRESCWSPVYILG